MQRKASAFSVSGPWLIALTAILFAAHAQYSGYLDAKAHVLVLD
jgi:hypothetical protein